MADLTVPWSAMTSFTEGLETIMRELAPHALDGRVILVGKNLNRKRRQKRGRRGIPAGTVVKGGKRLHQELRAADIEWVVPLRYDDDKKLVERLARKLFPGVAPEFIEWRVRDDYLHRTVRLKCWLTMHVTEEAA